MNIEAALAALRDAGATQVVVTFALAPTSPAPAPPPTHPEPEPTPAARAAVEEALAEDPLYRSTSSRPVRVSRAAEEDDDGLD